MKRWINLSWPLDAQAPLYPGTPSVQINRERSISGGDSCNTSLVTLSSHAGTHVDSPRHFFDDGRSLDDYSPSELIFCRPLILDCPQQPGGVIGCAELAGIAIKPDIDLVLIRTGFQKHRKTDPVKYNSQNPCLSPEVSYWLRNEFPGLRALGVDCISVASPIHRALGRETHRALLQRREGGSEPLLIIEDMYLPEEYCRFDEVILYPLITGCDDGSPCAVIGRIAGD